MLGFSRDTNKRFLLNFESAKKIALDSENRREFSEIIESSLEDAIRFTDLKIRDLLIYPGVGIYIMLDGVNNEIEYVGKTTSRSFLGRILAHFACRRHAKMAHFSERLRDISLYVKTTGMGGSEEKSNWDQYHKVNC